MNDVSTLDLPVIEQTKKWLESVVIKLGFCPFAERELQQNSIHYCVVRGDDMQSCLESLILECEYLDGNLEVATTLLIYPDLGADFDEFLDFLALAESLLESQGYPGVYQLASFHPHYCFEGATEDDPANYTNRSPFPMLHLLREESLAAALKLYPHPEQIPQRNIQYAREIGETKLKVMLGACRTPASKTHQ
jgi:uncharacterized protein